MSRINNRSVITFYLSIVGKMLQISLLIISTAFLLISGVSVAVGWARTCKSLKYIIIAIV